MQVWIEQHGGTLITAAVILLIIVAIIALGADGYLDGIFKAIISAFDTKAKNAAGLNTSMINLPKLTVGLCA